MSTVNKKGSLIMVIARGNIDKEFTPLQRMSFNDFPLVVFELAFKTIRCGVVTEVHLLTNCQGIT